MFGITQPASRIVAAMILSTALLPCAQASVLPDIPQPFKNGTGAIIEGVIYVGLGSADQSWYQLDLRAKEKSWQKIADFPGTPRDQAITLALNNQLYVFGGLGKEHAQAATSAVLSDVYRYNPSNNQWDKIDTHPPRGFVGHAGVSLTPHQALILGGVNKSIFDGYLHDLSSVKDNETAQQAVIQRYFDKPIADYFFSREALLYDANTNQWHALGITPFAGTAGSSLVRNDNQLTLINGELKPGLRSDQIHYGTWRQHQLSWIKQTPLPPPPGETEQEGLAGAYAGYSHSTLLLAGGANFPGAQARYRQQHYYAHQDLSKTWQRAIYAQNGEQWQVVGELPQPLGYGVSIQYDDSLYLIGGETQQGQAVTSVIMLSMREGKLTIEP